MGLPKHASVLLLMLIEGCSLKLILKVLMTSLLQGAGEVAFSESTTEPLSISI